MKDNIKVIILATVLAIATIGLASFQLEQPSFLYSQVKSSNNGKIISYNGKDGATALELLKEKANIKTNGTGKNAFVTSINGVAANPKNQYWMFKINDKMAEVGAGDYKTKNGDKITWELASF